MNRLPFLALLIAAGVILALAACNTSPPLPPGATPTPKPLIHITGSGVALDVPTGWTYRNAAPRGLVVALAYADLSSDTTRSPRLVAVLADGHLPNPAALFATIRAQQEVLHDGPQTATIDGRKGVVVESEATIGDTVIFTRSIFVPRGDGLLEVFSLEAPADQWLANVTTLEAILASARLSMIPSATPTLWYPYDY